MEEWRTSRESQRPCGEGTWMGSEDSAGLLKASAHNRSLVEGIPAGWVRSWCELSIRSEGQKDKEALWKAEFLPKVKGGRFSWRSKWVLFEFSISFAVFSVSSSPLSRPWLSRLIPVWRNESVFLLPLFCLGQGGTALEKRCLFFQQSLSASFPWVVWVKEYHSDLTFKMISSVYCFLCTLICKR